MYEGCPYVQEQTLDNPSIARRTVVQNQRNTDQKARLQPVHQILEWHSQGLGTFINRRT